MLYDISMSTYYGDNKIVYVKGVEDIRWGIDIQGGVEAVFTPDIDADKITNADMEKAEEIFVFPASFGWNDLGTWGSLHLNSVKDSNNNALIGSNINMYESKNCVVHTTQEKKVVIQGLDGYIIAEKDDTLLVCRLSEEQRIKDFAE
jgi:mannose-1-phosphate guanylyltransferase